MWVYGYGSLIWRPDFAFEERRLATLHGHHRALCLWSRVNRGTPECPGLVFGLDRGGSCRGVAYRLAGDQVPDYFPALWDREMSTGAYLPLDQLQHRGRTGPCPGLRHEPRQPGLHPRPARAGAAGHRAPGLRPLRPLHRIRGADRPALRAAGIHDSRLDAIARRLEADSHALPETA